MKSILSQILAGEVIDQRTGLPFYPEIKNVWIEDDTRGKEPDFIRALNVGKALMLLADSFSYQALGERVEDSLGKAFNIRLCLIDGRASADEATLQKIKPFCLESDAIIAVGSGTINDLAKYSAAQHGKPYIIFATAPSMNGYASKNASVTIQGHKKTRPARPPLGVIADLAILAKAPPRSITSGLGDSLARSTAQTDWLLSHLIMDSLYLHQPFDWLLPLEEELYSSIDALRRGDLAAHRALIENLLLSGLGMNFAGGSYPASQGEHLLAHYMEMKGASDHSYHGEQIALTARAMSFIHDNLFVGEPPILVAENIDEEKIIALFGEETGRECWREFREKKNMLFWIDKLNERIHKNWGSILDIVRPYHRSHEQMTKLVTQMHGPLTPMDIDWPAMLYKQAFIEARYLRNRFTGLDVACLSGVMYQLSSRLTS